LTVGPDGMSLVGDNGRSFASVVFEGGCWVVGLGGGWTNCCGGVGAVLCSDAFETPLKILRERDSFLASRDEGGAKSSVKAARAGIRNSSAPR
jgi:hypothetical protein